MEKITKVYMLCVLPGSGKTTYVKNELPTITRFTLDEELFNTSQTSLKNLLL